MPASRRKFLQWLGRGAAFTALGAIAVRVLLGKKEDSQFIQPGHGYAWQIDPAKCTFCGRCERACVRKPSAVKAVNDQKICSNCVVCYGHTYDRHLDSARIDAEGRKVCHHNAVVRTRLTGGLDGAFCYSIRPEDCTGCAKCALECNRHGTKSMFMVIRPDLCVNCNTCSIADVCESGAVERVPSYPTDDYRGEWMPDSGAGQSEPTRGTTT